MSHTYDARTGIWRFTDGHYWTGYSGTGEGRNNPDLEARRSLGPIPVGKWTIHPPHRSPNTGPYTMALTPLEHDAHGRSLFRIHGDNSTHTASHGCIILSPLRIRVRIWESGVHLVEVIDSVLQRSSVAMDAS